jgi:hypothetical protein
MVVAGGQKGKPPFGSEKAIGSTARPESEEFSGGHPKSL